MKFELIAVEPSGNGSDLILRVRRHPTWWESTLGRTTDQVSYFGPRPFWVTMDGREVNRGEQRCSIASGTSTNATRKPWACGRGRRLNHRWLTATDESPHGPSQLTSSR